MKTLGNSNNIRGDEMIMQKTEQLIYDNMQKVSIKTRCYISCVMNTQKNEILKQFLWRNDRCIQKLRSAFSACGIDLQELSVWKTLTLYCIGHSYRLYSSSAVEKQITDLLSKEIKITKNLLPQITGNRSRTIIQGYLDLLLEYRYKVQAFM